MEQRQREEEKALQNILEVMSKQFVDMEGYQVCKIAVYICTRNSTFVPRNWIGTLDYEPIILSKGCSTKD